MTLMRQTAARRATMARQWLAPVVSGLLCTVTGTAFAHDGHSLVGSHWHATDSLGFVAAAAAVAAALWWGRK